MYGLEIKITADSKDELLALLEEVKEEVEAGHISMWIPSENDAEADFSIVEADDITVFDDWGDCNIANQII
jgi:hypothetical protein